MNRIKVAIAGVGNCASSLIQGIHYYKNTSPKDAVGLMHWDIGGYAPGDIQVVAAFDIDRRKVGRDLHQAVFSPPNCTTAFFFEHGSVRDCREDGTDSRRNFGTHEAI